MITVRPVSAEATPVLPTFRYSAFGLDIESTVAVPLLASWGSDGPHSARRVTLNALERAPLTATAHTVFERRFPSGRPMLIVRRDEDAYQIWAPRHGRYSVSSDGRRIAARVPTTADWWWTKLLFAQVLPLAASLQGVECLHASCVALDGRAYALSAPSGTGKSSVALHLATRGGRFVCDDILATDVGGRGVSVHSGPSFTAADPAELARVPAATRPRALAARDDPKTYIELATACGPLPLERMYFLRRDHDAAALEIRPLDDARPILASRFLSYLTDPDQLLRHLETAAALAARVDLVEVLIPDGVGAVRVAETIAEHVRSER